MKTFPFLLTGLLLLQVALQAATTGNITGRVMDTQTQQPVGNVEVVFENSMDRMVVTTTAAGYYYANHLPTGRYTVTVKYNNRTFVMKGVRVYYNYATETDMHISSNAALPDVVQVDKKEEIISSISPTDIMLVNNQTSAQPTQTLSGVLNQQPGMDVRGGRLYVKGSSDVRFFIDGTPIMGPAVIQGGR